MTAPSGARRRHEFAWGCEPASWLHAGRGAQRAGARQAAAADHAQARRAAAGRLPGPASGTGHRAGGVARVPARRRRAADGLAGDRAYHRRARPPDGGRPGAGDLDRGGPVGAVVGTGSHVRRLPARPGRKEAQGLLRAVGHTEVRPGRADLGALVDMLNRPPRRRGLAVVISDFLVPVEQWERPLRKLGVRHDLLAVEIVDPRELELPNIGVIAFVDPESGAMHEVQTADARLRARYAAGAAAQRAAIASALRGAGAAHLRLRTDSDWLLDIVRFVAAQRHARTRGTTR